MNSSQILIRPYTVADRTAVIDLFRLNVPDYFHPTEEPGLHRYLDEETEQYFVAVTNDQVVGAGGINHEWEPGTSIIAWDMIHPAYQGKGVGMRLLKHRLQVLAEMSPVPRVIVRTSQHTFGFYEKGGFVLKQVVKDYWAPGFDLYDMELGSLGE